jgi:hypothetical protein
MRYDQPAEFRESVIRNQQTLASNLRENYDLIVCGTGTSGSVVAARLAANPDIHVLVLEAGNTDESDLIINPHRWPMTLGTDLDWGFVAELNPNLNGRAIPYSMGKVLGGKSVDHLIDRNPKQRNTQALEFIPAFRGTSRFVAFVKLARSHTSTGDFRPLPTTHLGASNEVPTPPLILTAIRMFVGAAQQSCLRSLRGVAARAKSMTAAQARVAGMYCSLIEKCDRE